jgi:hypothetical protein
LEEPVEGKNQANVGKMRWYQRWRGDYTKKIALDRFAAPEVAVVFPGVYHVSVMTVPSCRFLGE